MTGGLEALLGATAVEIRLQENEGDPSVVLPPNRLGPVRIRRGRTGASGVPEPSTCSLPIYESALPFPPQLGQYLTVELGADAIAALGLTDPDDPAIRRFSGTLTDATVRPRRFDDVDPPPNIFDLVFTARWARFDTAGITVGAAPWPEQTDSERASAIIDAVDYQDFGVGSIEGTGTAVVLARDVDAQAPLGLLADLARDARATLDEKRRFSDLVYHPFSYRADAPPFALRLRNAEIVTGSTWAARFSELRTRAEVVYGDADPRDELTLDDADGLARFGPILERVDSQLAELYDAENLAGGLVTWAALGRYTLAGLSVDAVRTLTDNAQRRALFRLEPSQPVATLEVPLAGVWGADLPDRDPLGPQAHFVEGWTETISREGWRFDLNVTPWAASMDLFHDDPLPLLNFGPSFDQLEDEGVTYDALQAEGVTYDALATDERT